MKKHVLLFIFSLLTAGTCFGRPQNHRLSPQPASPLHTSNLDVEAAQRFPKLALACVHKEHPNKLPHSLNNDADVAPPRNLTPPFSPRYDSHPPSPRPSLLARLP